MKNIRLISRLDVKGPNLIKTIRFEGLRKVGNPNDFALKYFNDGVDEIIFIDIVASLYQRNNLDTILKNAAKNIFVPITAGGGIRNIDDAQRILRSGADKIAVNTAAIQNPNLIRDLANNVGTQSLVISIEAKKNKNGFWEAFINNGRDKTGLNVLDWAKTAEKLGAGEVLLTSVDKEGTRKGFDLDLIKLVCKKVKIPVVACGGMYSLSCFENVVKKSNADAVAISDCIHFNRLNIQDIKKFASSKNISVRK